MDPSRTSMLQLLLRNPAPFRPFRRPILGHMGMGSLGACPHT